MGFKLAGIMFILMLAMGGGAYWYYTDTQERMRILAENNAKLEIAVQTQQQAIEQQKKDIAAVNAANDALNKEFQASRAEVDDLKGKFNKVSKVVGARDIGKQAIAFPKSIEKIITKGSNNIMRCFEILSGQPLTEKEANAEKPSQSNTMCPEIANPRLVTKP